jgi:hypothetical protein
MQRDNSYKGGGKCKSRGLLENAFGRESVDQSQREEKKKKKEKEKRPYLLLLLLRGRSQRDPR